MRREAVSQRAMFPETAALQVNPKLMESAAFVATAVVVDWTVMNGPVVAGAVELIVEAPTIVPVEPTVRKVRTVSNCQGWVVLAVVVVVIVHVTILAVPTLTHKVKVPAVVVLSVLPQENTLIWSPATRVFAGTLKLQAVVSAAVFDATVSTVITDSYDWSNLFSSFMFAYPMTVTRYAPDAGAVPNITVTVLAVAT